MADRPKRIDELASMLDKYGLTSIKLKEGDFSLEVRRDGAPAMGQSGPTHAAVPIKGEGSAIPSPTVGVFYSRPTPGEEPFVSIGDRVSVGQVVGIIEAMKVFNEIESPIAGVVMQCLVEDGQVVEEGDPLFLLEP